MPLVLVFDINSNRLVASIRSNPFGVLSASQRSSLSLYSCILALKFQRLVEFFLLLLVFIFSPFGREALLFKKPLIFSNIMTAIHFVYFPGSLQQTDL